MPRHSGSGSIYGEAGRVLSSFHERKGSVRALVFNNTVQHKEPVYALVCQTLKFKQVLEEVLRAAGFFNKQKQEMARQKWLVYAMVYDLLMGKGLVGGGRLGATVLKYKTCIKAEFERMKVKAKVTTGLGLLAEEMRHPLVLPRYVRVNTLKAQVDQVLRQLACELANPSRKRKHDGPQKRPGKRAKRDEALGEDGRGDGEEGEQQRGEKEQTINNECLVERDKHLADVLVLPPKTKLSDSPLAVSGWIVLQDKASCFAAHALSPPQDAHVIDCCAAPGNKTSHLAALMHNTGRIFAFDSDPGRFHNLKKLTAHAGASNITAACADFLAVDPSDPQYADVEYILADPSCSGSGIVSRFELHSSEWSEEIESGPNDLGKRLAALSSFQISILKHCFKFPKVKRIVYSTCSLHEEENEKVVETILEAHPQASLAHILPQWPRRGHPLFAGAEHCVRTLPEEDKTIGFFVACFEISTRATAEPKQDSNTRTLENTEKKEKARKRRRKKGNKKVVTCTAQK